MRLIPLLHYFQYIILRFRSPTHFTFSADVHDLDVSGETALWLLQSNDFSASSWRLEIAIPAAVACGSCRQLPFLRTFCDSALWFSPTCFSLMTLCGQSFCLFLTTLCDQFLICLFKQPYLASPASACLWDAHTWPVPHVSFNNQMWSVPHQTLFNNHTWLSPLVLAVICFYLSIF